MCVLYYSCTRSFELSCVYLIRYCNVAHTSGITHTVRVRVYMYIRILVLASTWQDLACALVDSYRYCYKFSTVVVMLKVAYRQVINLVVVHYNHRVNSEAQT